MQENLKLTSFKFAGRVDSIRLLLSYGGIKYDDERLSFEEYGKAKAEGRFKYGQLPVLEINGKQFAQSQALILYAAQRSGLLPQDPLQIIQIEQVLQNFMETQPKLAATFLIKDEAEKKAAREALAKDVIPLWLERIEQALVDNGSTGYISGKQLTYGDIVLFTFIKTFKSGFLDHIPKTITDQYTEIQKVANNVEQHPKIKAYYAKVQ